MTTDACKPTTIRVAACMPRSYSAGPGPRYELWVQGCTLECPGCFNAHLQDPDGGQNRDIESLARKIAETPGICGLSVSGGEPFQQSSAVLALVRAVRHLRPDLDLLSYSGYTREELLKSHDPDVASLLAELDYLIDGRYQESQRLEPPVEWRGSANQRFLILSSRARPAAGSSGETALQPSVTVRWSPEGVHVSGFPSDSLLRKVRQALEKSGFTVSDSD